MKNKPTVMFIMLITCWAAFIFHTGQVLLPAADREKSVQSVLEAKTHKGKVTATMDSGGYTYIEFEENGTRLWAAAPKFTVSVGDTIEFSKAMPMNNFHSKTLDRTFESILFVGGIKVTGAKGPGGTQAVLPKGHADIRAKTPAKITVKPGSIKKAENGYTVAECYALKDSLEGKIVNVRGKVVKFTAKIMGKNWIHIQDGTGNPGSDDLTVTTAAAVRVGDLVLVSGKIAYDRNVGAGYIYPVIIEDAAVIVQ